MGTRRPPGQPITTHECLLNDYAATCTIVHAAVSEIGMW